MWSLLMHSMFDRFSYLKQNKITNHRLICNKLIFVHITNNILLIHLECIKHYRMVLEKTDNLVKSMVTYTFKSIA